MRLLHWTTFRTKAIHSFRMGLNGGLIEKLSTELRRDEILSFSASHVAVILDIKQRDGCLYQALHASTLFLCPKPPGRVGNLRIDATILIIPRGGNPLRFQVCPKTWRCSCSYDEPPRVVCLSLCIVAS